MGSDLTDLTLRKINRRDILTPSTGKKEMLIFALILQPKHASLLAAIT
jgi:hypothetical protein